MEVKSVSGNASEKLVEAIRRHLQTWPRVRPAEPVGGGVLIVNHQHKLDPDERDGGGFAAGDRVLGGATPAR